MGLVVPVVSNTALPSDWAGGSFERAGERRLATRQNNADLPLILRYTYRYATNDMHPPSGAPLLLSHR